jgi:uncharacterized protein
MRFEWDPKKAEANLRKHKVSFEMARLVFEDRLAVSITDTEHSEGEERWMTLGRTGGAGSILVVCHVYRERGGEEVIRIISARKATAKERRQYTSLPGYRP